MNIINTDIVSSTQDVFWDKVSQIDGLEQRPVLIVSSEYGQGSKEEEQLLGILKSGCRLLDEQYNIIQLKEDEKAGWHQLREQLAPRVVLLLNILPAHLGVAALLRLNEINRFDNCYWIPTVSLAQLMQDVTIKGQLWNNALKPLFVEKLHGDVLVNKQG